MRSLPHHALRNDDFLTLPPLTFLHPSPRLPICFILRQDPHHRSRPVERSRRTITASGNASFSSVYVPSVNSPPFSAKFFHAESPVHERSLHGNVSHRMIAPPPFFSKRQPTFARFRRKSSHESAFHMIHVLAPERYADLTSRQWRVQRPGQPFEVLFPCRSFSGTVHRFPARHTRLFPADFCCEESGCNPPGLRSVTSSAYRRLSV